MPSIKQRPGSKYWVCCYTRANGERVQVSTKQEDRERAWAVCLEFSAADAKARAGMLTEAQARRVVSEIVEKTIGEPLAFHTAEAWLREWLAGKKQTKAEGTYERYEHVIEDFIASLGKRAGLNITQITPKDIRAFRDSQVALGKTGKTCNLAVKIVGAALNAARRQGFIQSNPAEALEPLPHTAEEKGTFTIEQVRDLLANATSPDWRGAIVMGFYTGARLRDVANMTWNSIDLTARTVRFVPQKTKRTQKQVVIPLHPELHEVLLEMAGQDNPNAPLFPSLTRKGTGGAHGLSESFKAIMDKAGIKDELARPRKGVKGRAISRLSFHSFRHGFNSVMANNGIAQEIRQKLTGHASAEMNNRYTHHEIESLRPAVSVIPALNVTNTAKRGEAQQ